MVLKGLRVGDTFTDGGLKYVVKSVDTMGNYISSLVGKASGEVESPKEEVKEADNTSYEDIPYSDLKRIAKEKGVSAKGSKEEVIERLKGV